jgi:hypothetical protein
VVFVVEMPANVARMEAEGVAWLLQKREAAYEATADVAGGAVEPDADVEGQLLKFKLLAHTFLQVLEICKFYCFWYC